MKLNRMAGLSIFIVSIVMGFPPVALAKFEGADGFKQAMKQHQRTGKPMVLFVYTDWCPHCRKFIKETLNTSPVRRYMRGILEVWLNPDDGKQERALADQYGVTGYPTLFMFPWNSQQARRINRAGPSKFVELCQAAAGTRKDGQSTAGRKPRRSKTRTARDTSGGAATSPRAGPFVVVYLRDGEVVKGRLAGETSDMVLIDTGNDQMIYFRNTIERIVTNVSAADLSGGVSVERDH